MAERVTSIFVESGAMYCCIWVRRPSCYLMCHDDDEALTNAQILWIVSNTVHVGVQSRSLPDPPLIDYMEGVMAQITVITFYLLQTSRAYLIDATQSIYPLLIFLLIALERTHADRDFSLSTKVRNNGLSEVEFAPRVSVHINLGHSRGYDIESGDSANDPEPKDGVPCNSIRGAEKQPENVS